MNATRDASGLVAVDKPTLCLWYAHPQELSAQGDIDAWASLLSGEERQRMERFRFERHRREFLATRVLLRTALSFGSPRPPASWRFKHNPHGKPSVDPECSSRFNVSNCPDLVVCLTSEGIEVGIDAESHERAATIAGLATEVFSPVERSQIDMLSVERRQDRALSLWTLKEAWIKAHGMGMSLPLQNVSFHFDQWDGICLELDSRLVEDFRGPWRFCLLDHAGHRIAIVAETSATPLLEVRAMGPQMETASVVAWEQPVWHPRIDRL
jgi:4'-phosphopantetheinyl transferase